MKQYSVNDLLIDVWIDWHESWVCYGEHLDLAAGCVVARGWGLVGECHKRDDLMADLAPV